MVRIFILDSKEVISLNQTDTQLIHTISFHMTQAIQAYKELSVEGNLELLDLTSQKLLPDFSTLSRLQDHLEQFIKGDDPNAHSIHNGRTSELLRDGTLLPLKPALPRHRTHRWRSTHRQ